MSLTSDMNFLDLLFDKEDPSLNLDALDKDDLGFKTELIDIDTKPSYGISSETWPSNPDEFLDSLLSFNDNPFDVPLLEIPNEVTQDPPEGSLSPPTAVVSSSSSDSGMNSDVHSDEHSDEYGDQSVHDIGEDSGASVDLQMSPLPEEDADMSSVQSMPESPEEECSILETATMDVLDTAVMNAGILDSDINAGILGSDAIGQLRFKNNTAIINMNLEPSCSEIIVSKQKPTASAQQLTLRPVKSWKRAGSVSCGANGRQVIRVTPMPAVGSAVTTHPRSILLPLQDLKDVRTIKILNGGSASPKHTRCRPMVPAVGKGTPVTLLQVNASASVAAPAQSSSISSSVSYGSDIAHTSGDESSDDSSDVVHQGHSPYPRVLLSIEEKRLMEKEGVTLPTHYPLTKQEERELKRIRRKIRNKISAQDSRKRKKEYVDGLEDRVRQCTDENRELLKRLKVLQSQNESLATQLHRLRAMVARGVASGGSRAAQPATCLMVLLLSLALVMVPNLRPGSTNLEEQELASANNAMSSNNKLPALPGRSRNLLHLGAQLFGADTTEEMDLMDEEEITMAFPSFGLKRAGSPLILDHDYSPSEKKARVAVDTGFVASHFIDPAIDDTWPPPAKQKDTLHQLDERIEALMEPILNYKTENLSSSVVLPVSQEGL